MYSTGTSLIEGFKIEAAKKLILARNRPFQSLNDFRIRTGLSTSDLETLASAHAFRALTDNRFDSFAAR